jgi:hypothetical protein
MLEPSKHLGSAVGHRSIPYTTEKVLRGTSSSFSAERSRHPIMQQNGRPLKVPSIRATVAWIQEAEEVWSAYSLVGEKGERQQ